MAPPSRRVLAAATAGALLAAMCVVVPVTAADAGGDLPRIRTSDSRVQEILASGPDQSPTLRGLLAHIDASDVIVHVIRFEATPGQRAGGLLQFTTATNTTRYLRIGLRRDLNDPQLATMLAHELQHAVEVAQHPGVVCDTTLRALYGTIGYVVDGYRLETDAAIRVAEQVRSELDAAARAASSSK